MSLGLLSVLHSWTRELMNPTRVRATSRNNNLEVVTTVFRCPPFDVFDTPSKGLTIPTYSSPNERLMISWLHILRVEIPETTDEVHTNTASHADISPSSPMRHFSTNGKERYLMLKYEIWEKVFRSWTCIECCWKDFPGAICTFPEA